MAGRGLKGDAAHRITSLSVAIIKPERHHNKAKASVTHRGFVGRCIICPMRRSARHNAPAHTTIMAHQIGSNRSDFALEYSVTIAGTRAVS